MLTQLINSLSTKLFNLFVGEIGRDNLGLNLLEVSNLVLLTVEVSAKLKLNLYRRSKIRGEFLVVWEVLQNIIERKLGSFYELCERRSIFKGRVPLLLKPRVRRLAWLRVGG